MMPLHFGTAAQFEALRSMLGEIGYTETGLHERLQARGAGGRDGLDVMVHLFLDGKAMEAAHVRSLLPASTIQILEALGLLGFESSGSMCRSLVQLYPLRGLYIVSDHTGDGAPLAEDFVFPALTEQTLHFLNILPEEPCGTLLDLCAGTGIAALLAAAHYASHAWACDITERAVQFAEFNRRLNGLPNVTVARGDLYEPVGERQFDRIVAHPPYVPALSHMQVFRDGGEDGEAVTRRILAGLPQHLGPGGRLYCAGMGSDRRGKPLEQRVRQMLGERESEFDVAVVSRDLISPAEHHLRWALTTGSGTAQVAAQQAVFVRLEIERLVLGAVIVQRKSGDRPAFTVRRQMGVSAGPAEIEWLLAWESAAAEPGSGQALLEARPAAPAGLRLRVLNELREGRWTASECTLETDRPFPRGMRCPGWVALLIARCDGSASLRDHLRFFRENGTAEAVEEEFVPLAKALVSQGFLEVEAFPLPPEA